MVDISSQSRCANVLPVGVRKLVRTGASCGTVLPLILVGTCGFKKNAACPYVANSSPRLNECCFEPLGTSFALQLQAITLCGKIFS